MYGAQRYIRAFCFDLVGQHCGKTLPSLLAFLAIVVILFNFPFLSGLLWLCPDLVKDKHEDTECGLFSTKSHSSSFLIVQHEALMLSPVHKAVNSAIDYPIYLYELDYMKRLMVFGNVLCKTRSLVWKRNIFKKKSVKTWGIHLYQKPIFEANLVPNYHSFIHSVWFQLKHLLLSISLWRQI